jgi:hypothetical protein
MHWRIAVSVLTFWLWIPLLFISAVADKVGLPWIYWHAGFVGWWLSGIVPDA